MYTCEPLEKLRGLKEVDVWRYLIVGARLILASIFIEGVRTFFFRGYSEALHVEILALELLLTMSGGYFMLRSTLAIYHLGHIKKMLENELSGYSAHLVCDEIRFNVKTLVKSIFVISLSVAVGFGFYLILRTYNDICGVPSPFRCWISLTLRCPSEKASLGWVKAVDETERRLKRFFEIGDLT